MRQRLHDRLARQTRPVEEEQHRDADRGRAIEHTRDLTTGGPQRGEHDDQQDRQDERIEQQPQTQDAHRGRSAGREPSARYFGCCCTGGAGNSASMSVQPIR